MKVEQVYKSNKAWIWHDGKYIKDFPPYFFVDDTEYVPPNVSGIVGVKPTSLVTLDGTGVKMIICRTPSDVPVTREIFGVTYESDIPFEKRAIIDLDLQQSNDDLCYIDIELSTNKISDIDKFGDVPLSVTTIKHNDGPYEIFGYCPDHSTESVTVDILGDECKLQIYDKERDALTRLVKRLSELRTDAFVEYAFRPFDMTHLVKRCCKYGIDTRGVSPINEVDTEKARIKGIETILYGILYKEYHLSGLRDNSLDSICIEEKVGTKYPLPHKRFKDLHMEEFTKLIEYNKHDVKLLYDVERKLKLVDNYTSLANFSHTEISGVLPRSNLLEKFFLANFRKKGIVLPNNDRSGTKYEKFAGAYVMPPVTGLHEQVAIIDFDSFYPSIIKMLKVPHIADMIDEQTAERNRYKILMNKYAPESDEYAMYYRMQTQRKFVSNTTYGYMSYYRGRLGKHFRQYSEQVAATAKRNILETKDVCTEMGFRVLAGDTDSLFLSMDGRTKDDFKELCVELNKQNRDRLFLSFEKIYKKILIRAKKRYAAHVIWEGKPTDKMEYKGLETRRSDSSVAVKDAQTMLLDSIFGDEPRAQTFNRLSDFIKDIPNKSTIFVGIPTKLNFDRNDYRDKIAKYTNSRYKTNYKTGDKPFRVPAFNQVNGICFDDDIDFASYNEHVDYRAVTELVIKKLNMLFEPMGWDVDEFEEYLRTGTHIRQMKL